MSSVVRQPTSAYRSLGEAIRVYFAGAGHARPEQAAIAIAAQVTGDIVRLTNHAWSFSIDELRRELGIARLVVLNDFTALALAIPALASQDIHRIGNADERSGAALAVIGPGTGLGVSGLIPGPRGQLIPLSGEGGHASLAPIDDRDVAVVSILRRRFGRASAERALSGPGLVNLYGAACELSGRPPRDVTPADVVAGATGDVDPMCPLALDLFFGFLGSVAGDLALTLGARSGVYIGGGIVARLVSQLRKSEFRERFEGKGRFRDYLADIPTFVVDSAVSAGLLGAARALDQQAPGPWMIEARPRA